MATLTSSFAIGYVNYAAGKTITCSSRTTGYPDSNLNTSRLSTSWRSGAGSLTTQNVDVDLSSSLAIDVVALIGGNLTDAATRSPVLSNASNFTSPLYNPGSGNVFNLSYPDLATVSYRYGRNLIILPGQTYSPRYVRVTLNDSGNTNNYLSARVYWAGPLWQPGISFPKREGSFVLRLEPVGEPGIERVLTYMDVSFDVLSETEGRALRSIVMERLRTKRLLVIPRPDQPATWQAEALYCTLVGGVKLTNWPQGRGEQRWKVQLTFKECED